MNFTPQIIFAFTMLSREALRKVGALFMEKGYVVSFKYVESTHVTGGEAIGHVGQFKLTESPGASITEGTAESLIRDINASDLRFMSASATVLAGNAAFVSTFAANFSLKNVVTKKPAGRVIPFPPRKPGPFATPGDSNDEPNA